MLMKFDNNFLLKSGNKGKHWLVGCMLQLHSRNSPQMLPGPPSLITQKLPKNYPKNCPTNFIQSSYITQKLAENAFAAENILIAKYFHSSTLLLNAEWSSRARSHKWSFNSQLMHPRNKAKNCPTNCHRIFIQSLDYSSARFLPELRFLRYKNLFYLKVWQLLDFYIFQIWNNMEKWSIYFKFGIIWKHEACIPNLK